MTKVVVATNPTDIPESTRSASALQRREAPPPSPSSSTPSTSFSLANAMEKAEVEPVAKRDSDKARQLKTLCADIKSIISSYIRNEVALGDGTRSFFEFLGKEATNFFGFNLKFVAESYPRNWTDERKCSYLIDVTSSTVDLRPAINRCGIKWPTSNLIEIKKMFEEENEIIQRRKNFLQSQNRTDEADRLRFHKWNYDTNYPYDLVRMVRNFWKHFTTLPWELQKYLGNRAGALHALERWCPGVWCLIYNAVGIV